MVRVDATKWMVKVGRLLPGEADAERELTLMPHPIRTLSSELLWIYLSIMTNRTFPHEMLGMICQYVDKLDHNAKKLDLLWGHIQDGGIYFSPKRSDPFNKFEKEPPQNELCRIFSQDKGKPIYALFENTEKVISARQKALYEAMPAPHEPLAHKMAEVKEAIRAGANPSDSGPSCHYEPPLFLLARQSQNPAEEFAEYIQALLEFEKEIDFSVVYGINTIIEVICYKIKEKQSSQQWEEVLGLLLSVGAEHTQFSLETLENAEKTTTPPDLAHPLESLGNESLKVQSLWL